MKNEVVRYRVVVGVLIVGSGSRGSLGAVAYCLHPASQEMIILHVASPGKVKNLKYTFY